MNELDTFTRQYVESLIWSAPTDDDGNELDSKESASWENFDESAKKTIIEECAKFQTENAKDIKGREKDAGHDFAMTRNGHGVGFWDGDWPKDVGERLTEASKRFGEQMLYDENEKIFIM